MIKRINKRITYILATGLLLLALAAIGAAYMRQVQEQNRLSGEIKAVKAQTQAITTKNLESQRSALNITMLKYENDLHNIQAQLTTPLVVSDIFQKIESTAAKYNILIYSIRSGSPSIVTISGVRYEFIHLDFSATGTEKDVYSFIDSISNNFTTAVLQSIDVQITNAGPKREAEAKLSLTIYNYRGE